MSHIYLVSQWSLHWLSRRFCPAHAQFSILAFHHARWCDRPPKWYIMCLYYFVLYVCIVKALELSSQTICCRQLMPMPTWNSVDSRWNVDTISESEVVRPSLWRWGRYLEENSIHRSLTPAHGIGLSFNLFQLASCGCCGYPNQCTLGCYDRLYKDLWTPSCSIPQFEKWSSLPKSHVARTLTSGQPVWKSYGMLSEVRIELLWPVAVANKSWMYALQQRYCMCLRKSWWWCETV